MRKHTTIALLFATITFVMASNIMQTIPTDGNQETSVNNSGVGDSIISPPHYNDTIVNRTIHKDTIATDTLDSLHLAIQARNKAIDDSISADSANRRKKNGIDAPVNYTSKDSLVYFGDTKKAFLFGNANVKYEDMDLTAERINMQLDSSLVHATGATDTTTKQQFGLPVFLMGADKYETDTMAFNFKTKKGLIQNAYTAQQDGFLVSERSKRDSTGNFYLKHGKYTTCDDPEPDFYFALSIAKARPGKEVVFGPAYLVVQDVPLPFALPYGFFPFTKNYSS